MHKYMKQNCNQKEEQNITNLTLSEKKGVNSLLKRIKAAELVITKTNKGKVFALSSKKRYREQGK